MQSKNAIGNLINRYKAVLKKCTLINTFGSLALACAFSLGALAMSIQAEAAASFPKEGTDFIIKEVVAGSTDPYYKKFTVTDATGTSTEYGILFKGTAYATDPTNTHASVDRLVSDVIEAQKSTVAEGEANYFKEIVEVGSGESHTFSVKISTLDVDGKPITLYFAVKDGSDNVITQAGGLLENASGTTLASVNNNFIGLSRDNYGAAIFNDGTITSITSSFIGNKITASAGDGGAIYNDGRITDIINSTFTGNWADFGGGAIYNAGTITGITNSTFTGNSASAENGGGGAILNIFGATIDSISATFTGNTSAGNGGDGGGGAIYNRGTITDIINSTFTGNSASAEAGSGGAIFNKGTITDITSSTFTGNSASGEFGRGGAIYNIGTITDITSSTFTGNSVGGFGGAIYNNGEITSITTSTFTGNSTRGNGGAIFNSGTITDITSSTFTGNSTSGEDGRGGAIRNDGEITDITNSTFTGNWAGQSGGAIYTTKNLNFTADAASPSISGNYVSSDGGISKDYNAIYLDAADVSLTFNVKNGGSYTLDDNVKAGTNYFSGDQYTYEVNIIGDGTGNNVFNLNNTLYNAKAVTVNNATLQFGTGLYGSGSIDNATLSVEGTSTLHNVSATGATTITSGTTTLQGANSFADFTSTGASLSNSGTTIFKGTTTFGTVNVSNTGILDVGDASTRGAVTLAAGKSMTIESGGSLNVVNGTLDVSDGTFTVANTAATTFATSANGTLTVDHASFNISEDGKTVNYSGKKIDNSGTLIIEGFTVTGVTKGYYNAILEAIRNATVTGGIITLDGVIPSEFFSLYDVGDGAGLPSIILAGDLTGNKEVSAHGIQKNTVDGNITDSTIESGSKLILTGVHNTALLDTGSLENSGTLNLGVSGASHTSNFNGILTTTSTGKSTVLSETTFNQAVSNAGEFTTEAQSTFKDDFTSSGTSAFYKTVTFEKDLNVAGGSTNFDDSAIVEDDIDITGGTTTFHDSLSVKNVVEVENGTLEVRAGMTMLGETVDAESGKFDIQSGGTFNLAGGDVNLSGVTFSTAATSTLASAFGTELTVGIGSIGVDKDGKASGSATVNAATNVDALLGTVKITGFDTTFTLYDTATSSVNADYVALNTAATGAYGTTANIIFDGVTLDTVGLTLTLVADNNLSGLGEYSVDNGSVGSGKIATVGSIRDKDATGISATNNGGTLTITGQSTESGQENIIAIGDVLTQNNGITNLGNGNAISTVGGSVVSDITTTASSKTTLLNVNIKENLIHVGAGKTVAQGTTTVQGTTSLDSMTELQAQDATFTAVGDTMLGGGSLRTTSTASGNDIKRASAAFLHNLPSIDGNIIVEHNAYTVLGGGDRAYAEKAFIESENDWGTGVTAALFVTAPQTLSATGSVKVDGANTGLGAAGNNEAVFAANSLFVVDAAGVGSNVALTATDGILTVHSGAKLHVTGAQSGTTVNIVKGFTDAGSSIATGGWDAKNLTASSSLQAAKVADFDAATGSYAVEITGNTTESIRQDYPMAQGATIGSMVNVGQVADVNSPMESVRFFSTLADNTKGIGTNNPRQTVQVWESSLQMATSGASAFMGMGASYGAANTLLAHLSQSGLGVGSTNGESPTSVHMSQAGGNTTGMATGSDNMADDAIKNGLSLWFSPMYKYSTVQGVEAGAFKHGYDTSMGGLALGADYTLNNAFRVGLAFNLGTGYAQSTGDLSQTQNNFDFWGLSLYGAYYKNNFSLMADVGFTSVFGELSQDVLSLLGSSNLEAHTQSTVWTAGLTAEYIYETSFMDIIPHAGVRYMYVNTGAYDTENGRGTIAQTESDGQSVWYFPVGVTFSKDLAFESGWTFTPKLDVGFIAAAGDLHATSVSSIPGVAGSAEYTMQNVDGFAFNGGVGFDLAHADNGISLGLNYNIQASEHETGHMLNATFRYDF